MLVLFRGKAPPALPVPVFPFTAFPGKRGDGALGIVGGNKIHQRMQRRGGIVFADAKDGVRAYARVATAQKCKDGAAEGIVHHGIQPLAQQVGAPRAIADFGGGVFPHFPQKEFVLPVAFYRRADGLNKIVRQFIRHIQPGTRRPPEKARCRSRRLCRR